jgi:hypothetical protein
VVLGYRARTVLRLNPVTWFGFRLYGDEKVEQLLKDAGFAVDIRMPRRAERIVVGTKAGGLVTD